MCRSRWCSRHTICVSCTPLVQLDMELHVGKILVVDLGTTLLKFTLFDRDGRLIESNGEPLLLLDAPDGRMGISADALTVQLVKGIAVLKAHAGDLDDVEAVTFATQTNSFILLGNHRVQLTPIILWPDTRARIWSSKPAIGAIYPTSRP